MKKNFFIIVLTIIMGCIIIACSSKETTIKNSEESCLSTTLVTKDEETSSNNDELSNKDDDLTIEPTPNEETTMDLSTQEPTTLATEEPIPTQSPTQLPVQTETPTIKPTIKPTDVPTKTPTTKPIETTKPTETPTTVPTEKPLKTPKDYSSTAMFAYDDPLVQQYLKEGIYYPTIDYNKVPVVDIDSMLTYDKMGPNCSGLSNLSKPWHYMYDAYNVDTLPYFTWNEEIPLYKYVIWNGRLGFIYRNDQKNEEFYKKLYTTDFEVASDTNIDNVGEIQIGNWTNWSEEGYYYVFTYIKKWK